MTYLLRIDVSARGATSHSRRFADEAVEPILSRLALGRVVRRDFARDPPSPIDEDYVRAMLTFISRETSIGVPALSRSEAFIDELEAAQAVLISSPVHNYTVPASLKAWIDHIVRVGRTFEGTPAGKVGRMADRPVVVVSASGGYFSGGAARQPDFFTPYIDAILATIGIRSVTHIRLEGLSRGEEAVRRAYQSARDALSAWSAG
jgi:FMN-dependent NADH-azoreductase